MTKPKRQRQPKRQPTPEQVAETVRTNAQELYLHYRGMLYRSDSKDIPAHAEAVVANEALGVLAYSIPPCDAEAFDSPMVCAYRAMHVLSLLNKVAVTEVREYGEALKNAPSTEEQVAERTKRHREMEQSIRESAERMCKSNADQQEYPDIKRNMQATDLYAEAVAAHEALEVVVWNAVPANLDELDAVMQRADVAMNAMTDRAFEIQQQQNAIARGRPILPFEEGV